MQTNTVDTSINADILNKDLQEPPEADTPMKEWLVDYVGNNINPENDEVTLSMIVEVMAKEFPEFLLALAEENWVRGYHQAITDMETGRKLYEEELQKRAEDGSKDTQTD